MARPGSAGACQSRKAGPGGGALQLGRRPGLSGFGGPALDVGRCGLLQDSGIQPGFASAQSLRDLNEVLLAARPQVPAPVAPKTQPRYLLHAGGADGGIDGPAEIEPTCVVCSSARQPTLDESVVRCSTKDRAIAGAVTETASSNSGRSRNRRVDPR